MKLADATSLTGVIDFNELMTRCLNNLDFAERMLNMFLNHCGDDLVQLDRAFDAGDIETARRVSHRFAGASANAAATQLHVRATQLRSELRAGSMEAARPCLHELHQEWQRFAAAMSPEQLVSETT